MIIVISTEKSIPHEIEILHQLFDAGLSYFHLRKPFFTEKQLVDYLSKIDKKYIKRIVLHQHHHLAKQYHLKGIHLRESFRKSLGEDAENYVLFFQQEGYSVSSAFHQVESVKDCAIPFDYYLLSPIFDSISKAGYKGKDFSVDSINKKIVGMGGITADNFIVVKNKGFHGIAVLGAVWHSQQPLQSFKDIIKQAEIIF